MLTIEEREAVKRWYSRQEVLDRANELIQQKNFQDLELYLHKTCLLPIGRHDQLPDYLRTAEGAPMFPQNLNPLKEEERWQGAIEVGWEVIRENLGVGHDDIHRNIANEQEQDWEAFLASVEERKKARAKD